MNWIGTSASVMLRRPLNLGLSASIAASGTWRDAAAQLEAVDQIALLDLRKILHGQMTNALVPNFQVSSNAASPAFTGSRKIRLDVPVSRNRTFGSQQLEHAILLHKRNWRSSRKSLKI